MSTVTITPLSKDQRAMLKRAAELGFLAGRLSIIQCLDGQGEFTFEQLWNAPPPDPAKQAAINQVFAALGVPPIAAQGEEAA